jgi:hypothetical protein
MPAPAIDPGPAPTRPPAPRDAGGRPLTIASLLAIIAALLWSLDQAHQREDDLRRRLRNYAEGYRSQQAARRELFVARQTIARLRAGLEAPDPTAAPIR